MINKFFLFLLVQYILFGFSACKVFKPHQNCRIVLEHYKFYSLAHRQYMDMQTSAPDNKIWYRKNSVIEEIRGIYIKQDGIGPNIKEERMVKVMGYLFIHLPSRSFYEYGTMSDTSLLIRKYTQPDSVDAYGASGGGWNFYYTPIRTPEFTSILSDTIIKNVTYKRNKFIYGKYPDGTPSECIGYFRQDVKKSMFQLDKKLSDRMGSPITRCDWIALKISQEVEFVTDKLTPEENKVFDVWERYAQKHPVK